MGLKIFKLSNDGHIEITDHENGLVSVIVQTVASRSGDGAFINLSHDEFMSMFEAMAEQVKKTQLI